MALFRGIWGEDLFYLMIATLYFFWAAFNLLMFVGLWIAVTAISYFLVYYAVRKKQFWALLCMIGFALVNGGYYYLIMKGYQACSLGEYLSLSFEGEGHPAFTSSEEIACEPVLLVSELVSGRWSLPIFALHLTLLGALGFWLYRRESRALESQGPN